MTEKQYVIAIDQGPTSSRAIRFNRSGEIVSVGQKEFTQIFPNPGWVEHDPVEIWESVRSVVADALQKAETNRHEIAAVGITNQRETTIVWDKSTGKPVYNALVWQDVRTGDIVREIADGDPLGTERYRQITGENVSTYPSATKIKWILDNVEGARERAEAGDLLFGTPDTWVLWNLTGGINGGVHATDVTNASRTLLMDVRTLTWREDICADFGIPTSMLPEIKSSNFNLRAFGERVALNMPIQGTAADLIKLAMIRVDDRLRREGLAARLILQVHDELIVECPDAEVERVKALLTEEMEGVSALSVPMKADSAAGQSWAEAKE